MGSEPASLDFALIGHTENWQQVRRMMDALRRPGLSPIRDTDLQDAYPWIPPRTIERLTVSGYPGKKCARGVYIETFIPPDSLGPGDMHRNTKRVVDAIRCAIREGAPVAALGGFTSILLQKDVDPLQLPRGISLTTGNSLTAAFIVKGVERAASLRGISMHRATVLIVGSTGDLGRICASYFGPRVRQLLLSARTRQHLRQQVEDLCGKCPTRPATGTLKSMMPQADVVIAVASLATPALRLGRCKPNALVCDAGYPKNAESLAGIRADNLFWGGMGRALGGWRGETGVCETAYQFPLPGMAHGCLLEGMVLGLEGRRDAFSTGRGKITLERMEDILSIAARHGIVPAPLFNHDGLWSDQTVGV